MARFDWLSGRPEKPPAQDQPRDADPETRAPHVGETPPRPDFSHAERVPDGDFRFIALDVETACRDAASICQIGLACVQPDNEIQTYSVLVNPGTRFDRFNIQLHGIGPERVADAPRFPDVWDALLPLLTRHRLVQHSSFDKRAVASACDFCGIATPDLRWSDSVTIARRAWPELKGNGGHGLANLKRSLDLQFHHHDAGEDARAAAMVVLHAERHLAMSFEELIVPRTRARYPPPQTRIGAADGPLSGSTVVFTGSLGMSRKDAADLAALAGMNVDTGVTRRTTHLVVGDRDLGLLAGHKKSSKHRKAEDMRAAGHPIRIIGETEFNQVLMAAGVI